MVDVLSQDYVRTAKAKGVDQQDLLFVHALKNAAVPVGSLQRCYGVTLTVEAVLPALNAQLGILYKMFQVHAGHAGA